MKINIITLGCSKNTVDSENLAGHLAANHEVHFDRSGNDCDCVIINTCGFIGDAKEESVNVLLEQTAAKKRFNQRHRHDGRQRILIAAGCLIERYRKELKQEIPEVDAWYGVHEWEDLINYIRSNETRTPLDKTSIDFTQLRQVSTPSHYAYIKISEGCDRSCAYCAIPHIRGRHISRPIEEIVSEAQKLVSDGAQELIIIAQDTTYYGLDLYGQRRLGDLLHQLATQSGAHWIRLHYTYPTSFPQDAIQVMRQHKNICNYIDIPLQHINTELLHSMRRGIDRESTLRLLDQFRQQLPDVTIRTTLIVGYPGETDEIFQELKDFVRQARFDRMGCFAYSPEEGTPAEVLGDPIADEVKQQRVSELMAIQEQISLEKNEAKIGHTYEVLVDRIEGDYAIARTEFDSPDVDDEVLIPLTKTSRIAPGHFYNVQITDALENDLLATLVE